MAKTYDYESSARKKSTTLMILEILKRYTDDSIDENTGRAIHSLTQAQIVQKINADYGMKVDRKLVKRGLNDLIYSEEYGDKIEYDTLSRTIKSGSEKEDSDLATNFRFRHEFDSAQMRWLMDAVLFSKNIPASECKQLLEQLGELGNLDARKKIIKNLFNLTEISDTKVSNDQIFHNIDILDEAIDKNKQVSFIYNDYGKDKKLHPKLDPDGNPIIRIVNPYRMVANNGRYYLICNYDAYDNATNIRIDKITDIEILNTSAKPKKNVTGLKDLPATMAEQIYMQGGKCDKVTFKADKRIISQVVDWFGNSVKFGEEDEANVICTIKTNLNSMKYWAMQYSDYVEILEPKSVRNAVMDSIRLAWKKYNQNEDLLVESDANIKSIISDWNEVSKSARDRKLDVKAFGELVRRTHIAFLPFLGKELTGQYAELMLKLSKIGGTRRVSESNAVLYILESLQEEINYGRDGFKYRNISDDILVINLFRIEGKLNTDLLLDLNNFEEDFLTLMEYMEKEEIKAKAFHEEMRKRIKEKHDAERNARKAQKVEK